MKNKRKIIIVAVLVIIALAFFYRYSPRKFEFLGHYDKIGAHRVNSVDKLSSSLRYFDAIELDLVYMENENILDVVHPPTPSIGLEFSEYAAALNGATPFLWLDIKNLNEKNAALILQQLNLVLETHTYDKTKVLIETRYPEALPPFDNQGYKTSFYLPQSLSTLNKQEIKSTLLDVESTLKRQPNLSISTSYIDYDVIKTSFPKRPKYLWSLSHRKFGDYSMIREFLKDETVKLVLVRYKPL